MEEQTSLEFQGKELKFLMGLFGSPPYGQARLCEALSEGSDAFEIFFFFYFIFFT